MLPQVVRSEFLPLVETQLAFQDTLLSRPNVVGVGLGHKYSRGINTGERAITVLVHRKVDARYLAPKAIIPPELDGVPTDVQEVGMIRAGGGPQPWADRGAAAAMGVGPFQLGQRVRPAFAGVSVGHYRGNAGTFGAGCFDAFPKPGEPGRYYILSTNYVLADTNGGIAGDPILQPALVDGGRYPADVIGKLVRYVPIQFHDGPSKPLNFVDAAIAEGLHDTDRRVYWAGEVSALNAAPNINDTVQKWGRTTNFTTGHVLAVNATVDVHYDGGRIARFGQQIITTNMSAGGDSGSLVTDPDEGAVGLLFAGSVRVSVLNNIVAVQSLLGVRVTEG
ncbi:serine protease [Cryptosporangium phraense]|uniref:Serine protease n=1 Tax=Cryptosporangium phraense TaxID=2593070 RepID=A0A545AUT1_9ACTN|nr:serine protease [Cryptosporangium phraense]TQS45031.1 serine protease [Cryptosporangium phraense]